MYRKCYICLLSCGFRYLSLWQRKRKVLRTGRNLFCKFIPASGGFVCFDSLYRDEDTCYRFRESVPFAFGSSGWRDGFYNDLFNSCIVKSGKIDSDNTGRDCQFVYLLITRYQLVPRCGYSGVFQVGRGWDIQQNNRLESWHRGRCPKQDHRLTLPSDWDSNRKRGLQW